MKNIFGVEVKISHPFVDRRIPLIDWIRSGPPPERPKVAPISAFDKDSGARLPLTIIPFRYRNTYLSRLMIQIGIIPGPWGGGGAILPGSLDRDFNWHMQQPGAYERLKGETGQDFGMDEAKWEKWCEENPRN